MRLNEICSLEWSDVKTAEDVTYFDIPEAKTESSIRVVPVQNALAPFLALCPHSGYLFPDLVPGGPDKKRGWNIGRDFGRLTLAAVEAEQLKAEERSTFHGFRKNRTSPRPSSATVSPRPRPPRSSVTRRPA